MRRKPLLRLFVPLLAACATLQPRSSWGFLVGNHRRITEEAIDSIGSSLSADKAQLLLGAVDADLVEAGIPFVGGSGYDSRFHFDSFPNYAAIQGNFRTILSLVRENIAKPQKDPWEFGKILHAVQDFYSHSNYVPLYRGYRLRQNALVGSIPTLEEARLRGDPAFEQVLAGNLITGVYPNPLIAKDWHHGHWFGPGLQKDTFQRDYHLEARRAAMNATIWYLRLYLRDAQARSECERAWGLRP